MLSQKQIQEIAQLLYHALLHRVTVSQLNERFPLFSLAEAYQIQDALARLRTEEGEEIAGYKLGVTDLNKMLAAKINMPLRGYLLSSMLLPNNSTLSMSELIQPKAELEIAFVLKDNLSGSGITTDDVLNATDYIMPVVEVVDSRFNDFSFSLTEGVADNLCAGRLVIGSNKVNPADLNLADIDASLSINGQKIMNGNSSAVLDDPLNSVVFLAKMLAETGMVLRAGSIISSGAIAGAIPFTHGDELHAEFSGLGSVSFIAG